MGVRRIITAVLTIALLGFAPLALSSPASADDGDLVVKKQGAAETERAARKAKRPIRLNPTEPRPNKFIFKGRTKAWQNLPVKVRKRNCGSCDYFFYKKIKTDNKSRFRTRVRGPRRGQRKVCYQLVVPESKRYRKTRSSAVCIVRR